MSSEAPPREGTWLSTTLNLGATALGSGILSLPQAFAYMGCGLGTALCLFSAMVTDFTLQLLVDVSRNSGLLSYEGNALFYLGMGGKVASNLSLMLLIFMAQVAMVVIVKQLAPNLVQLVAGNHPDAWYEDPTLVTIGLLLAIFPVCLMKTLTPLKFTSSLVLFSVAYVFMLLCCRYVSSGLPVSSSVVAVNNDSSQIVDGLSAVVGAFICQFQIFQLDAELRPVDRPKIRRIIHCAMLVPATIYTITGLAGYLLFGADVYNNFLLDFGSSIFGTVARALLAVGNLCKLPLFVHPLRVCLGEILPATAPRNTFVETFLILAATLGMALALKSLSKVMALIGCTCGVVTCFILPGFMHVRMHLLGVRQQGLLENEVKVVPLGGALINCSTWALAIGGSVYMVIGLISTYLQWDRF